jgi:hypothetical protein
VIEKEINQREVGFLGNLVIVILLYRAGGGVVFKALRYKPAGRGSIPSDLIGIFQ